MLGIGIDTGGTCTDAVIYDLDTKEILGAGKALTTKSHLETGIANALDTLPRELTEKAEVLALSTTLATNACVENKGCRAKLLMIGFDPSMIDHLKEIYASYGFRDLTQFIILDAKVENLFPDAFDPDWEDLRRRAPEYFSDCDSIGIVQKHPRANGGRFELTARQILREEVRQPITIACDISNELDILKTCAGTMLNARLIPLISEFMEAVHHVMEDRNLRIPLSIVRSDGTLMSEEMAKTYPVETLLCGPAASVIGGSELSGEENAIIVDMGGTTTDVAIVRRKSPVMAREGIKIGQWQTMVKGLFVDTFGLGGDSAVRFADNRLYLDAERVIPLSILADQYDHVLPSLQKLSGQRRTHSRWIHEFYVLQKDISGKTGYTEDEQKLCSFLKEKPLITLDLAERMGRDPRYLSADRLLQDGVLMKSGLTPTDMMVLKGDFTRYDRQAAEYALRCLQPNISTPPEQIPDLVYELVIRKMYQNLCRILLQQQYPKQKEFFRADYLDVMLDCFYEQAKRQTSADSTAHAATLPGKNIHADNAAHATALPDSNTNADSTAHEPALPDSNTSADNAAHATVLPDNNINADNAAHDAGLMANSANTAEDRPAILSFTTDMPLIGVGAPIHIFLPRVGKLLHTPVRIPAYAGVANALGAVTSQMVAHVSLTVKAEYDGGQCIGYSVFEDGQKHLFEELEEAVAFGQEVIVRAVKKRAALQGITRSPQIDLTIRENRIGHVSTGLLLEVLLDAAARNSESL